MALVAGVTAGTPLASSAANATITASTGTSTVSSAAVTAVPFARTQDNGGRFVFVGPWKQTTNAVLSGGTARWVSGKGALFGLKFSGTAARWSGAVGPSLGKAAVYIDGVRVGTVDQSAARVAYKRTVWSSATLRAGTHRLEIVSLGVHGSRGTGSRTNVDAVDVRGSVVAPAPPSGFVRAEETDGRLTLFGSWSSVADARASSGRYRSSAKNGSGTLLAFKGTAVSLVGPVGSSLGRGYVYLDGKYAGTTDQRSSVARPQQLLWSCVGLANATHLLEYFPQAATTTTLNKLALDAVYVKGSLSVAPRRIEESDSRLGSAGPWVRTASRGMSGDTYRYAVAGGAATSLRFSGSRVRILAPRSTTSGEAEVLLDGQPKGIVSLYASSSKSQQVVWQMSGLSETTHTVEIRALGSAAAASRGERVGIDAFDVWGSVLAAPRPSAFAPIEEDDARLSASGTWSRAWGSSMSGRRYAYCAEGNGSLTVRLQGTGLRWIGPMGSMYGSAELIVDGVSQGIESQSATSTLHRQEIWSVAGLPLGEHTVQIRLTSPANANGVRKPIAVDALHVLGGTLLEASRPAGVVRMAATDGRAARTGTWTSSSVSTSTPAVLKTRDIRSRYDLSFQGTSVTWIGSRGPDHGIAQVILDGKALGQVDLYDYALHPGRVLWSAHGLSGGQHRLSLRLSGRRGGRSSSFFVGVQSLDVAGKTLATTAPFEQDDWRLAYTGRWASRAVTITPDIVRASAQTSSTVTLRFSGTRLRVVAPVGPASGIASVSVDWGRYTGADLYSAQPVGNQVIFDTGELPAGVHAVRVLVTGRRNPSASGSEVAIDGFEVFGGGLVPYTAEQKARAKVIDTAIAQLGKRYVWAGVGPTVFDCSGLMLYAYKAVGISLPHYSGSQWRLCVPKRASELLPGDLCFTDGPTYIHHVGMYIGDGITINAPGSGRYVEYRQVTTYGCFGRLRSSLWPR